ncbi:hypothetical protein AN958_06224 [Leucoagaricus sp. SymC.cos]|nr:hypothetical protein AN958_06224 [Leucoagaricus sp. SymC.cos]
MKIIYILTRFLPFPVVLILSYSQSRIQHSTESCTMFYHAISGLYIVVGCLSELILSFLIARRVRIARGGGMTLQLLRVTYRDGIAFYAFLTGVYGIPKPLL